ncbi:uncharacterized protein LOC135348825 [Halichondria panicea]|uniref:uncharacterized protein LOC135348825 n=1 Tax=Halichondria panicea TaxID=6063 RepID=UPI00312B4543
MAAISLESSNEFLGTLDLPVNQPVVYTEEPNFTRWRCYKVRYRFRWITLKGAAYLILLWTFLVSIGFGSLDNLFTAFLTVFENREHLNPVNYVIFLPYVSWFVFSLLSGWIADTKCGNFTMVRAGVLIYFVASIMASILQLCVDSPIAEDLVYAPSSILLTLIHFVGFAGRAMILVTSVQLGLDQMPDASSANVASYVVWFVACLYAGNWINSLFKRVLTDCWAGEGNTPLQVMSLVSVVSLCIVLCSDFLLSNKLLILENKRPQSFQIIFKVLKFAKKHKAPLNRSALTYYEDAIPSRIDLGKSRYGGPFTTEEVENVKTVLRMLALSVSFGFIFTSYYLFQQFAYVKDFESTILASQNCTDVMIRSFSYETSLWVVGFIAIYEFLIYPFAVPIIPSILKKIGFASFLTIVVNGISLVVSGLDYNKELTDPYDSDWFWIMHSLISAPLKVILLTSAIEFVCAQSPHQMKGLMIGYMWSNYYMSNIVANVLAGVFHTVCSDPRYCSIAYSSMATLCSVTGFVLLGILSRWYKMRVRDDIATPHRWVEDAYEKYLASDNQNN